MKNREKQLKNLFLLKKEGEFESFKKQFKGKRIDYEKETEIIKLENLFFKYINQSNGLSEVIINEIKNVYYLKDYQLESYTLRFNCVISRFAHNARNYTCNDISKEPILLIFYLIFFISELLHKDIEYEIVSLTEKYINFLEIKPYIKKTEMQTL